MRNGRRGEIVVRPGPGAGGRDSSFVLPQEYRQACGFVEQARLVDARRLYAELNREATDGRLKALIRNDLAILAAVEEHVSVACEQLRSALAFDDTCEVARINLSLLKTRSAEESAVGAGDVDADLPITRNDTDSAKAGRVAILSFLFNWPSTGGGIVHTVELTRSLIDAGYQVRLFYACHPAWGIGRVETRLPFDSQRLEFDESGWTVSEIHARFRRAVDGFRPDFVLITDSWNMKPVLAEAMRGYPYFLRFQALECLCPLNNLRLLARRPNEVEQCPRHQLATADACRRCLEERGRQSGQLHHLERALAGVGTPKYQSTLRRALKEAEAVLVLNPLTQAMLSPYAQRVCVVPWGMDPARFPWPPADEPSALRTDGIITLFMAAVAGEFIKGFHVLHEACARLRRLRTDFELVVTFDPPGQIDEFTRSVGWQSQEDLPRHYRAADLCVVPTIAQEGLSRTSVEAMASGLPVIASRIGGLPYTVSEGATGLLFEPGDPDDLASKIATLLDDPLLRKRMGLAGRKRFEEDFTWDVVIERYYKPLLTKREAIHG